LPKELEAALAQNKPVRRYFEKLSNSIRRDIGRTIAEAKAPETRRRRAEEFVERLMHVMDGEREPPPILRAAFAREPEARAAWDALAPSHKRAHLFGIFYYKTPEGRARRVEKAIEMLLERAARNS
jgi:uncharacterized protein YdeI (YjbR/CyaY-like superfamily)